jgi:hypothetical protein
MYQRIFISKANAQNNPEADNTRRSALTSEHDIKNKNVSILEFMYFDLIGKNVDYDNILIGVRR